jgi:hypothetical protein
MFEIHGDGVIYIKKIYMGLKKNSAPSGGEYRKLIVSFWPTKNYSYTCTQPTFFL